MIHSSTFSNDGKLIVSASQDKTVRFWDVSTGEELATLEGHRRAVYCCKFDSRSDKVVTGSLDKTVKLWGSPDGEEIATLSGHTGAVRGVDFSPDGDMVASCGDDGFVRLWRVWSGECVMTMPGHATHAWNLCYSPCSNDSLLTSGDDGELLLWKVREDSGDYSVKGIGFKKSGVPVLACSLSQDMAKAAACYGDGTVVITDSSTGGAIATLRGHTAAAKCCAFHPKNEEIATVAQDGSLRLWSLKSVSSKKKVSSPREGQPNQAKSNQGKSNQSYSPVKIVASSNVQDWSKSIRSNVAQLYKTRASVGNKIAACDAELANRVCFVENDPIARVGEIYDDAIERLKRQRASKAAHMGA